MRSSLLVSAAVVTIATTMAAHGQSTESAPGAPVASEPQPSDAGDSAGALAEVTVTAQRRSESLQKAAVAVDVVNPAALANSGLNNPTQLGTLIPALNVQANGGANTIFFLRGVGNFTINGYSDPAIAFNYDGVYVGRATATSGYFYDLDRIEVLKGPQGTIYGRNATAGAINVIPAKPVLDDLSGAVTASYGNYDAYDTRAYLNAPVGDNNAVRFSATLHGHNGYLSDGSSDDHGQAARLQWLSNLTPDLSVRVAADYSHTGGLGTGAIYASRLVLNSATGHYASVPSGLSDSTGLLDPAAQAFRSADLYSPISGRYQEPLGEPDGLFEDNSFAGVNAEINWKSSAGVLTVIPAYRSTKLDNIYDATGSNQFVQENDSQYSLETRFAGERISIFDYLAGVYYFDEHVKGNYTFDQQVYGAYQDFLSSTKSYAVFGRLAANITSSFRLVGGLRFTEDKKDFNGQEDVITVVCRNPATPRPACPNAVLVPLTDTVGELPFAVPARGGAPVPQGTDGAVVSRGTTLIGQPLDANKVTERAAVEYDVAPESLLYASFETGYRSGGFSLAAGHQTFQPEYINAYTVGSKNRFLDNRLQVDLEAFLWKYRNQQISHSGIDANGVNSVYTDNAGQSTIDGFEAEIEYLLTRNTLINVDAQYLHSKFDSFIFSQPRTATPPITGCPYAPNPANSAQYLVNCSGESGYQSPTWTLNFGLQQTFPLGDYQLVPSADTQFKTSRWIGFDYLPFEHVGSTWTTNANLAFGPASEKWSVTAYVRNIEDDRIPQSGFALVTGLAGMQVVGAPRTFGIRGNVKF
jgi:iron complex outermembrane receptor protein